MHLVASALLALVLIPVLAQPAASDMGEVRSAAMQVAPVSPTSQVRSLALTQTNPDQDTTFNRDAEFIRLMNVEREAAGLIPLVAYFDLVDDAALHTTDMVSAGDIYHSSDLTNFTTDWQTIGENVGYGPSVEKLHRAFMASPTHRANIMGDYDHVGVSSDLDENGRIYVTVLFMKTIEGVTLGTGADPLLISETIITNVGVGLEK